LEKIFPEQTPTVTKVELVKKGKVRRAVLSYLRTRVGRKATKIKDVFVKGVSQEVGDVVNKKEGEVTEEQIIAKRLKKAQKAEKAAKKADKVKKEKKKAKKKSKVVSKEKSFVR
jgi:N-methylhydantoinase A/oxoprolinase/acetone carboxylase beta subunit